jgi:16S rRNA (uracil1498-N3)-methyltransferase
VDALVGALVDARVDEPRDAVTAPLFLLPPDRLADAVAGSALALDGEEGRHAAAVRRIRPGERVEVADGAGVLAECLVTAAGRDRLELRVDAVHRLAPARPRLVLAQALAKGGRDELAVETATEVGVDAVVPWQAERSVVRWQGERGERARRRWADGVRAAAKQARRAWVPVVEEPVDTAGLARRAQGGPARLLLILHEEARTPLTALLTGLVAGPVAGPVAGLVAGPPPGGLGGVGEILLAVGPEGGVAASELAVLEAAGGRAVRLGPHVLRSSTAGPVALALLASALGRWGAPTPPPGGDYAPGGVADDDRDPG